MLKCGLLGERLGHSYSTAIHAELGDYEYRLYEKGPRELERFLREGDFDGLNVTIPYKKDVISYCDVLSETASAVGSVNTIVRGRDGRLFGYNTDAFGFGAMLAVAGIDPVGKKAVILGSGGASAAVCYVLDKLGAQVVVVSRSGENNYGNLILHQDAAIVVNTTPVGMYPNNMRAAVDLTCFPRCESVLDIVYNPARTALLLQAQRLGIKCASGLYMLVAQAKRSSELFTGTNIDDREIARIEKKLSFAMQNIVLVGMPGSGKSTVGKALAEKLGRGFEDADAMIEKAAGMTIPQIFSSSGEAEFRRIETQVLAGLGKRSGAVIATGGGCVTREENYPLLHQNSCIIWLCRGIEKLPTEGRPLSTPGELAKMFDLRRIMYADFADFAVDNNGTLENTLNQIMEVLQ